MIVFVMILNVFGGRSVSETISVEIEFHGNGTHFLSVFCLRARALAKHDGLSKVRNSVWLRKGAHKLILFGCRHDSQNRGNKTVFRNVLLSVARGHLGTFGPTYDLDIFRLADPGCCSFFRNT